MAKTIMLNEADLVEEFSRSSGPGGQNVNKVSSRVVLRHVPTNISVTVQDSRSQAANRALARERLAEAVARSRAEAVAAKRDAIEKARRRRAPRPRALKEKLLRFKKHRAGIMRNRKIDEQ